MRTITGFIAALLFGGSSCFAFEIPQPDINVGTNWTFKKIDGYTGNIVDTWKQVVEGTAEGGYLIGRYSSNGGLVDRYTITRNLGQGSPVSSGKMGDGNLYQFPLTSGKSWTTRNYWVTNQGGAGYDEITYTVKEEQPLSTEAGTFKVVKVMGKGTWKNEISRNEGAYEIILYYSPLVQGTVRIERQQQLRVGPPNKDAFEVTAFEIK